VAAGALRTVWALVDEASGGYSDGEEDDGLLARQTDLRRTHGTRSGSGRRAASAGPSSAPQSQSAAAPASALLRAVVVDCSRVIDIDATGCRALGDARDSFTRAGVPFLLAALPGPVRDTLQRFGVGAEDEGSAAALRRSTRLLTVAAALRALDEADEAERAEKERGAVAAVAAAAGAEAAAGETASPTEPRILNSEPRP
jgi:anti-anti-sigma regulatory factor